MARNALQAVLDKAATHEPPASPRAPKPAPKTVTRQPAGAGRAAREDGNGERFFRPSRKDKKLVAGHFEPKVAKQLKLLAVEDDTTVQALLEEALDLLFAKKGRARIGDLLRVPTKTGLNA